MLMPSIYTLCLTAFSKHGLTHVISASRQKKPLEHGQCFWLGIECVCVCVCGCVCVCVCVTERGREGRRQKRTEG